MPDSASQSPHLEPEEQEQAGRHAPLPPLVIHEIVRAEGEAELERPVGAMLWSALAAGLSMGFSFAVMALLQSALTPGPGRHAVASFGYAAGFLIVVLGRQQLFTETTLTAVLPVLVHPDARTILRTVRVWNGVFAANVVGTDLCGGARLRPSAAARDRAGARGAGGAGDWPRFRRHASARRLRRLADRADGLAAAQRARRASGWSWS